MSQENNPARGEEREGTPESGLLLSVDSIGNESGARLSGADADAGHDTATDSDGGDSSSSLLDTSSDADSSTDADGGDDDAGSDVDAGDDGGDDDDDDELETESGLDGQNPLGINPDRQDNDGGGSNRDA